MVSENTLWIITIAREDESIRGSLKVECAELDSILWVDLFLDDDSAQVWSILEAYANTIGPPSRVRMAGDEIFRGSVWMWCRLHGIELFATVAH